MHIQGLPFSQDLSTYFNTGILTSLTPRQKIILAVTAAAFALLSACFILYQAWKSFQISPNTAKVPVSSAKEMSNAVEIPNETSADTILSISSIKKLDPGADANLEDTLFVFDIDDVLTILSDPAFQRPNFKKHHKDAFKAVMDPLNEVEQALAFTLPLLTTPSDLIETDAPEFILFLQKSAKTIALTAAMGVEIEGDSIEARRAAELARVGIDFSSSFPEIPETVFPGFKTPVLGKDPLFHKGIILTNENDKGEVLVRFLKTSSWIPKKVCFVDDREDNVKAVIKALKTHFPQIVVKGYHFQPHHATYASAEREDFTAKWEEVAKKAREIIINKNYFPRVVENSL